MSHYHHSKSGLFLMELLINLLLFCFLCGCGLMFFTKSYHMTMDATALHNAVHLTASIAGVYETGNGSLTPITESFLCTEVAQDTIHIYLDEDFIPCTKEDSVYFISVQKTESELNKIAIDFFDADGLVAYSITACNYSPSTLSDAKEVHNP